MISIDFFYMAEICPHGPYYRVYNTTIFTRHHKWKICFNSLQDRTFVIPKIIVNGDINKYVLLCALFECIETDFFNKISVI